jgi:hypothetical protein
VDARSGGRALAHPDAALNWRFGERHRLCVYDTPCNGLEAQSIVEALSLWVVDVDVEHRIVQTLHSEGTQGSAYQRFTHTTPAPRGPHSHLQNPALSPAQATVPFLVNLTQNVAGGAALDGRQQR